MSDIDELSDLPAISPRTARVPAPGRRRPSATRAQSARRARLAYLARAGNANALRHGIFAEVLNAPDIAIEIDLIYATHPGLDLMRDRRLAEALAVGLVQRARAVLAMQRDGLTPVLTSYESRAGALVERLERAVHDRERQRLGEHQAKRVIDLAPYAPPRRSTGAKR